MKTHSIASLSKSAAVLALLLLSVTLQADVPDPSGTWHPRPTPPILLPTAPPTPVPNPTAPPPPAQPGATPAASPAAHASAGETPLLPAGGAAGVLAAISLVALFSIRKKG
jgi:hypothetical protein